jgi:hypothetical protein
MAPDFFLPPRHDDCKYVHHLFGRVEEEVTKTG